MLAVPGTVKQRNIQFTSDFQYRCPCLGLGAKLREITATKFIPSSRIVAKAFAQTVARGHLLQPAVERQVIFLKASGPDPVDQSRLPSLTVGFSYTRFVLITNRERGLHSSFLPFCLSATTTASAMFMPENGKPAPAVGEIQCLDFFLKKASLRRDLFHEDETKRQIAVALLSYFGERL